MRFILDILGDNMGDLILKIDAIPNFIQVVDTCFLMDLFGVSDVDKINSTIRYIESIQQDLSATDFNQLIYPIDLSDQYIGILLFTERRKDRVEIEYMVSDKLFGFEITMENINELVKSKWESFSSEGKWTFQRSWIIQNLETSKQLIKATQKEIMR